MVNTQELKANQPKRKRLIMSKVVHTPVEKQLVATHFGHNDATKLDPEHLQALMNSYIGSRIVLNHRLKIFGRALFNLLPNFVKRFFA